MSASVKKSWDRVPLGSNSAPKKQKSILTLNTLQNSSFKEKADRILSKSINPLGTDGLIELTKENELIRKVLKDFNKELSLIIDKETSAAALHKKIESGKPKPEKIITTRPLDSVIEEMRLNEKHIERLKSELLRLDARVEQLSSRDYIISLESEIEKLRTEIDSSQKNNKILKNASESKGKNISQMEASGTTDILNKINELENEIFQYSKKNRLLIKKRDEIQEAYNDICNKLTAQEGKFKGLITEAEELKAIEKSDPLAERLDDAANKVLNMEKTVESLEESNQKIVQKIKRDMDDLKLLCSHRSRLISEKELEIIEVRKVLDEMMSKEIMSAELLLNKDLGNSRIHSSKIASSDAASMKSYSSNNFNIDLNFNLDGRAERPASNQSEKILGKPQLKSLNSKEKGGAPDLLSTNNTYIDDNRSHKKAGDLSFEEVLEEADAELRNSSVYVF